MPLALHGFDRIHPGQAARYELELVGDVPAIDAIELSMQTSRGYRLSSNATMEQRARLATARFSAAGARRFPLDVTIPAHWPPSHALSRLAWSSVWVEARLLAGARTVIEHHFPIHVCEKLTAHIPEPAIVRARQYVELGLGLGATRATGGTTLVGRCSISEAPPNPHVAIDVVCTLRTAADHVVKQAVCSTKVRVPGHATATGVPFTLPLPAYLPPTLAIDTHRIDYQVRATHRHWLRTTSVSIPIDIVDAKPAPARIRLPGVGEKPVEPVFAEVATRAGWRIGPSVDVHPDLGTITPWLYAPHNNLVMRLGYAFRDDGSTFLVSRIRYRPLDLGFRVVAGRGGGELSAGVVDWDRAHVVTARDRARANAMLTTVVPELAPLGALVQWDDHWLVCERQITEVDVPTVEEVANALRVVARKLAHVIGTGDLEVGPYR